jgi:integrase/recombinase XerD
LTIDDEGLLAFIKYVREDRRNCHKSLRNVFCALSSFYQYLLFSKRIVHNPIPHISKRYLRSYKNEGERSEKNILTVKEMARMISMISDVRDRALFMVLAKTGVRRNELITLDVEDVDLDDGKITLKPTNKRSNKVLFIDKECIKAFRKWLKVRGTNGLKSKALFTNKHGSRIHRCDLYDTVVKWAERAGYHNPNSKKKADRFYPHCFRHWFTTHLIRNGMPRDFVKELRGDARREAIDLYNHIDKELLKQCYLKTIPRIT